LHGRRPLCELLAPRMCSSMDYHFCRPCKPPPGRDTPGGVNRLFVSTIARAPGLRSLTLMNAWASASPHPPLLLGAQSKLAGGAPASRRLCGSQGSGSLFANLDADHITATAAERTSSMWPAFPPVAKNLAVGAIERALPSLHVRPWTLNLRCAVLASRPLLDCHLTS